MTAVSVLHAMVYRHVIELKRYAFNTLTGLVSVYILFLLAFLGVRSARGGETGFGHSVDSVVAGFFFVSLLLFVFSDLGRGIMREARQGTLEQLSMSPAGLLPVLCARAVAGLGYRFLSAVALLALMMATTGRLLHIDVPALGLLLLLTILGVQGIGFAVGGLALVFKEIDAALSILHLVIVTLIVAPVEELPALKYLPVSYGSALAREVMVEGATLSELGLGSILFLTVNSMAYFLIGLAVFRWTEGVARRQGLLSQY